MWQGLRSARVQRSPSDPAGTVWRIALRLTTVHQVLHQANLLIWLAVHGSGLDLAVLKLEQEVGDGHAPIIGGPLLQDTEKPSEYVQSEIEVASNQVHHGIVDVSCGFRCSPVRVS